MLWEARFWPLIADGSVTVTFRRWKRPQAVDGHRYRTPGGIIEVDRVTFVDPQRISKQDARNAGYESPAALVADLRGDASLPVTRAPFHRVDERIRAATLAESDELSVDDVADIDRRLARLDASSSSGPWTRATLDTIAAHPGVRAGDLATSLGRDRAPFKLDVRKLKNLGLTLSLTTGYQLSPRGLAYLHRKHA